jgi:hypothetical protein
MTPKQRARMMSVWLDIGLASVMVSIVVAMPNDKASDVPQRKHAETLTNQRNSPFHAPEVSQMGGFYRHDYAQTRLTHCMQTIYRRQAKSPKQRTRSRAYEHARIITNLCDVIPSAKPTNGQHDSRNKDQAPARVNSFACQTDERRANRFHSGMARRLTGVCYTLSPCQDQPQSKTAP